MNTHVVILLGDSVFDNESYTGPYADVVSCLKRELPAGWDVMLCALDGAVISDLSRQLSSISRVLREAAEKKTVVHLFVSVGGNNALRNIDLLDMRIRGSGEFLEIFGERLDEFSREYRAAIEDVVRLNLPTTLCTIYTGALPGAAGSRARTAVMPFNDIITRIATEYRLPVLELRNVCTEPEDFTLEIEPSPAGALKIARAVAGAATRLVNGTSQVLSGVCNSETGTVEIAFLHLAPVPADLEYNRRLLEQGVRLAAEHGADWILTPEFWVSGYDFADTIGTDWILPQPDPWMESFRRRTARLDVTVFLSYPERDEADGSLYNTLFVIGTGGEILGRHRKINTIKEGPESWSEAGTEAVPVNLPTGRKIGLLICADAYTPTIAESLKEQGAEILISTASWGHGEWGPAGEWEDRSRETGLPMFVCNRTGRDTVLDFTSAESVVVVNGRRVLGMSALTSTMFLVRWNFAERRVERYLSVRL